MITGPIAKLLVQHVAAPLFQQFISGRLQLFGSSLRDPGSGKVIGYLQARDTIGAASDTAKVIGALPFLANPVTAPFAAAYAVGKTGFAIFDTQRTAHRIEDAVASVSEKLGATGQKIDDLGGRMSSLSVTSLAGFGLQVLDIGLNVANFDKVNLRLDDISNRVAAVDERFRAFQETQLALAFAELRTLARALDEGWRLEGAAAENRWQEVASRSLHVQDQFETRARGSLSAPGSEYWAADALIDAVSFTNGLRVSALAACNQVPAAMEAAADGARVLATLTGRIGVAELAIGLLDKVGAAPGTQDYTLALAAAGDAARGVGQKIRQREANAVTRAGPLASLGQCGVRPRDWLESVRAADKTALVFMRNITAEGVVGPDPKG